MAQRVGFGFGHKSAGRLVGAPVSAAPQLPTENLAHLFDVTNADSLTAPGGLVEQWDDLVGGAHFVSSGGNRPTLLANATADGGPKERIRFNGSQLMTAPAGFAIDNRNCSIFIVCRYAADPARQASTLLHVPDGTTKLDFGAAANGVIGANDGSANASTFYLQGGAQCYWLRGEAAAAYIGVGNQVWEKGSAWAVNTAAGARIGSGNGGSNPLRGDIQWIAVYNGAVDETAVQDYAAYHFGAPKSTCNKIFHYAGDSLSEGITQAGGNTIFDTYTGDFSPAARVQMLRAAAGDNVAIVNIGEGGLRISQRVPIPYQITRVFTAYPGYDFRLLVLGFGFNDILADRTFAQITADFETLIAFCRGQDAGLHIGLNNLLPTNNFDANPSRLSVYNDLNDWLSDAGESHGADFPIDLNSIPELQDPSDPLKFGDGIHPTTYGYSFIAPRQNAAIAAYEATL